jgi:hypothetical protein
VFYLVGTPNGRLTKLEQALIVLPWQAVRRRNRRAPHLRSATARASPNPRNVVETSAVPPLILLRFFPQLGKLG